MINSWKGVSFRSRWWIAATLVLGWCCMASPSSAQVTESVSSRMLRQIRVMEGILDEVLVESPNFVVSGRDDTRGLYLEGYGIIFMFEATMVDIGDWKDWEDWSNGFRYEVDKDGRTIVVIPDERDRDEDEDADRRDRRSWRERRRDRERELYENGKREIRETLLDYGDTITTLDDSEWLAVAAFLKDVEYFMDSKVGRVVIRAKMSDLRDYAEGKISEDEMVDRFVEEEY